jgi:hypothetical protein
VRGQIDSCLHKFCFSCIIKWSEVTNTCPVCKRNFRQVTELKDSASTSKGKSKGKKTRKPKVVKIKQKPQRVDHPPPFPLPDLYSTDIRVLLMHFAEALWGSEDDSDYIEGEDEFFDDDEVELTLRRMQPSRAIDRFENGRHVIEILDDEDDEYGEEDDEVEIISPLALPPPPPSRRGRRGESLFGRVGSTGYRAVPSSSAASSSAAVSLSSSSSSSAVVTRAAIRSRTVPEVKPLTRCRMDESPLSPHLCQADIVICSTSLLAPR